MVRYIGIVLKFSEVILNNAKKGLSNSIPIKLKMTKDTTIDIDNFRTLFLNMRAEVTKGKM